MSSFKSQAKRKRELAKLDKRQGKEQKRAQRKAERSGASVNAATPTAAPAAVVAPALPANRRPTPDATPAKPLTLAEAVERWRKTKVGKPRNRP